MKRIFISAMVCLMLANGVATAQSKIEPNISKPYNVHEILVYTTFGLARIGYKLDLGLRRNGFNVGLGANYAYNIDGHFAVVSGLELAHYSSRMRMSGFSESYSERDNSNQRFTMMYSFNEEYSERQSTVLLSIPVMGRYMTPLPYDDGSMSYFVMTGMKFGIPFVSRATITPGTVTTSGYYEYEARTYTNLLEHGFVNGQSGDKTKSRIRFGVVPMLSFETGVRLPIGYKMKLSTSFYLDYCFANIHKSKNKHILEYQSIVPSQFVYNTVLNTDAVRKITLFSTGAKVGITF
jgi:hypothetical protein